MRSGLMGGTFTGVAQAAFDHALDYAHERKQGGVPIIRHQSVQQRLFHMYRKVEISRALTRRVSELNDSVSKIIQQQRVTVVPAPADGTVVEFYNASLDHYFISASRADIAGGSPVDAGSLAPWLGVLLVVIAVVAFVRVRRSRAARGTPRPGAPPTTDEENYLDSSHISGPVVGPRAGEVAAAAGPGSYTHLTLPTKRIV